jgi:predicted nucleotidyltransferase
MKSYKFVQDKKEALSLVQKRCTQLNIEPLIILMHGSRVSGNAYPASDWDFYVLADYNEKPVLPEFMSGKSFIDLGFLKYEEKVSPKEFLESTKLVPAQKFEVLYAKNEELEKFIRKVIDLLNKKYVKSKRETWSGIRDCWLETYFYRYIYRISECNDPLRRQAYISSFIDQICRNQYFHFTNQWNHSVSEGYKIIKNDDPVLYRLLIKLPTLKTKKSIRKNLENIYQYFIRLNKENPATMDSAQHSRQGSSMDL